MYVFALLRVCVYVREFVCVCVCVCMFRFVLLVLCLPVWVGETLYDPGSLGNNPFETRDLVPLIHVPLHRIGIFWYQFTPRKLL